MSAYIHLSGNDSFLYSISNYWKKENKKKG